MRRDDGEKEDGNDDLSLQYVRERKELLRI